MQENSLMRLRQVQNVTDLVRAPALDVAQLDHLALLVGERRNRAVDERSRLGVEHGPPGLGRLGPVAVDEALRVDGGLVAE